MNDEGFCKIEYSRDDIQKVIAFYDELQMQFNECSNRIKNGEFYIETQQQFFIFKLTKKKLDKLACVAAYEVLFEYAWWGYNDELIYSTLSELQSMCRLLRTPGTVYLSPIQCDIFRQSLKHANKMRM